MTVVGLLGVQDQVSAGGGLLTGISAPSVSDLYIEGDQWFVSHQPDPGPSERALSITMNYMEPQKGHGLHPDSPSLSLPKASGTQESSWQKASWLNGRGVCMEESSGLCQDWGL